MSPKSVRRSRQAMIIPPAPSGVAETWSWLFEDVAIAVPYGRQAPWASGIFARARASRIAIRNVRERGSMEWLLSTVADAPQSSWGPTCENAWSWGTGHLFFGVPDGADREYCYRRSLKGPWIL